MKEYLRFLLLGLILGLFTEIQLKLVAGTNPGSFGIVLVAYPVIITFFYAISRLIDNLSTSRWTADLMHYLFVGLFGLLVEWTLLGNGPGSNAIQTGMFAMWTTFGFGPRILTRVSPAVKNSSRRFWITFGAAAILLTLMVLLASTPGAKVVTAVVALSVMYICWSLWLLLIAWRSSRQINHAAGSQ